MNTYFKFNLMNVSKFRFLFNIFESNKILQFNFSITDTDIKIIFNTN